MKNDGQKAFYDFLGVREFEGKKYVEYEKYQQIIDELSEKEYELDNLKAKVADLEDQNGKLELPTEPIKVAEMLIYATRRRETNGFERAFSNAPDIVDYDIYSKSDLRQIAEHLLVCCNNS